MAYAYRRVWYSRSTFSISRPNSFPSSDDANTELTALSTFFTPSGTSCVTNGRLAVSTMFLELSSLSEFGTVLARRCTDTKESLIGVSSFFVSFSSSTAGVSSFFSLGFTSSFFSSGSAGRSSSSGIMYLSKSSPELATRVTSVFSWQPTSSNFLFISMREPLISKQYSI